MKVGLGLGGSVAVWLCMVARCGVVFCGPFFVPHGFDTLMADAFVSRGGQYNWPVAAAEAQLPPNRERSGQHKKLSTIGSKPTIAYFWVHKNHLLCVSLFYHSHCSFANCSPGLRTGGLCAQTSYTLPRRQA